MSQFLLHESGFVFRAQIQSRSTKLFPGRIEGCLHGRQLLRSEMCCVFLERHWSYSHFRHRMFWGEGTVMPQANSSAESRLHAAQRKDECGALCSCPALLLGRMWSPFSCGTQRAFRSGICKTPTCSPRRFLVAVTRISISVFVPAGALFA